MPVNVIWDRYLKPQLSIVSAVQWNHSIANFSQKNKTKINGNSNAKYLSQSTLLCWFTGTFLNHVPHEKDVPASLQQ